MKLFNGLRFKMIEGKRLKNYLAYAIGEILLVVIGILVAVTINNFNENKTLEEDTRKIALQIEKKIEEDLVIIKEVRSAIAEDLKLYDLYLKKDKTDSEKLNAVLQAPFLVTINIQFLPVNPIVSSIIEKASLINSDISNKLVQIEQVYKSVELGLRPMEDIIKNELIANLRYIKDNFNWYEKLVIDNSSFTIEEYKYFGSDDYRNRVVHMKFLYTNGYDGQLEEMEAVLEKELAELKAMF
ncbi:hypothetical protein [Winogradskyella sp. PE311]|uniref:hypothetical protein n=1 Tax=Winogradskyella sp. PE311 TaxID=3366943 RepID=UPI00397EC5DE